MRGIASFALFLYIGLSATGSVNGVAESTGSQDGAVSEALERGATDWRFPGEYESHQAMWMLWPTYENKAGFPSTEPMSDMIRAMRGHVQVNLAVQDEDDEAVARSVLTEAGVSLDHVRFFHIEHGDIWARDTGPQFTRSRSGETAHQRLELQHIYNRRHHAFSGSRTCRAANVGTRVRGPNAERTRRRSSTIGSATSVRA